MEKMFLDLAGLQRYNSKLKDGSLKVGAAKTADTVNSKGIKWDSSTIVPLANIPPAALERITVVADDAARLKLTTATVQTGDTVKVTSTKKMYFVKDDTKLNSEAGYEEYVAGTVADGVEWKNVIGKPDVAGMQNQIETFHRDLKTAKTETLEGFYNMLTTGAETPFLAFDSFLEKSKPNDIVFDRAFEEGTFAQRTNNADNSLLPEFNLTYKFGSPAEPHVENKPSMHCIPAINRLFYCNADGLYYSKIANLKDTPLLQAVTTPHILPLEFIVDNVIISGEPKVYDANTKVCFDKTTKQFVTFTNIERQTFMPLKDDTKMYGHFENGKTVPYDGRLYYTNDSNGITVLLSKGGDLVPVSDDSKPITTSEIDALFT